MGCCMPWLAEEQASCLHHWWVCGFVLCTWLTQTADFLEFPSVYKVCAITYKQGLSVARFNMVISSKIIGSSDSVSFTHFNQRCISGNGIFRVVLAVSITQLWRIWIILTISRVHQTQYIVNRLHIYMVKSIFTALKIYNQLIFLPRNLVMFPVYEYVLHRARGGLWYTNGGIFTCVGAVYDWLWYKAILYKLRLLSISLVCVSEHV